MQRCPYIHEMKERLLGDQQPIEIAPVKKIPEPPPPLIMDHIPHHQTVGTVVKLNPDGYGSHTSPTHRRADRAPLMPRDSPHDNNLSYLNSHKYPKNAKTSLFIIMSFVYAKLLVVICVAYVISDVVTHNIPLFYYEGFFTYLYGVSILFLLYVFCFLLQESTCCSGDSEKEVVVKERKPSKKELAKDKAIKEKEKKKEEKDKKKDEKEKKKKEEKDKEKKDDKKDAGGGGGKDKKKDKKGDNKEPATGAAVTVVPVPVQPPQVPPGQPPAVVLAAQQQLMSTQQYQDVEAGGVQAIVPAVTMTTGKSAGCKKKRKTTQNDQSHGSFFLRIGAIAFGLGTMIYSGLEFGSWFEIPFTSQCYMILRGINPALQMVFTFMQMYFIFMNSRLNIHRFKVIARFGLMHVVATNICVWIRTLVLEYLKEITVYHKRMHDSYPERIRGHTLRNANTILGSHRPIPDYLHSTPDSTELGAALPTALYGFRDIVASTARTLRNYVSTPATTPTTTRP